MRKSTKLVTLILFAVSGAALLLRGRHTIAGVGEDVSDIGKAIEKSAHKRAP